MLSYDYVMQVSTGKIEKEERGRDGNTHALGELCGGGVDFELGAELEDGTGEGTGNVAYRVTRELVDLMETTTFPRQECGRTTLVVRLSCESFQHRHNGRVLDRKVDVNEREGSRWVERAHVFLGRLGGGKGYGGERRDSEEGAHSEGLGKARRLE